MLICYYYCYCCCCCLVFFTVLNTDNFLSLHAIKYYQYCQCKGSLNPPPAPAWELKQTATIRSVINQRKSAFPSFCYKPSRQNHLKSTFEECAFVESAHKKRYRFAKEYTPPNCFFSDFTDWDLCLIIFSYLYLCE